MLNRGCHISSFGHIHLPLLPGFWDFVAAPATALDGLLAAAAAAAVTSLY
jgi:hypothetical protein